MAFSPYSQNGTLQISSYFLSGTSWGRCGFSAFTSFQRLSCPWGSPMSPELIVAPCNYTNTTPPLEPLCWRRQCVTYFWASSPCHSSCHRLLSLSCLSSRLEHPGEVIACTEAFCSWSDIEADHTCCASLNFLWFCCTLFEMRRPELHRVLMIGVSCEFTH